MKAKENESVVETELESRENSNNENGSINVDDGMHCERTRERKREGMMCKLNV